MRLGTLLKKELLESWRTYRAVVLGVVFLVFGILSPAAARYMPDIFAAMDMQGIVIQLPPPTVADANVQFVKNMSQIGAIVVILIAMGVVSRERDKGTVAFTLSKPVPRGAFLLAKALAIVTWAALALATLAHWYYTRLLLGPLPLGDCLAMAALTGVYLTALVAITFLGSTLTKSLAVSAAVGFGGYLLISLLGSIPRLAPYLPGDLLGRALAAGNGALQMAWGGLISSVVIAVGCWAVAWLVFRRVEL
ncbi:MAG: ABC transporter permease [Anaerolineae bacterium]